MNKSVFLETHNLKNRATGFGSFNYELIKGFSQIDLGNLDLILNYASPKELLDEFGSTFKYHKYQTITRYKYFRNRNNYDLYHSVNQNSKIEPYNPKKYLLTIHDVNFVEEISSDMEHKRNKFFLEKIKRASAISYISEFAKAQTHQYFNIPNIPEHVIYNGNPISNLLDTSTYMTNVPIDKPFFYSIGDFIERKNFIAIIAMMKDFNDFNLIISGNYQKEYGEEVKKFIDNNNLKNRVFLTGKVTDLGKQFFMKNCTAFLFPSIREGFGLPPIEAMSFGKPIFLSDKTSLPEIGGKDCYYWNNFEPDYMKNVLINGLDDFNSNKTEMIQKMKTRAACFDWKIAAKNYLNVYNEILSM